VNALVSNRRDSDFGSQYSLPTDSNPYRGGSLERGINQRSQPTRGGLNNSSLTHDHSSKQETIDANTKSKQVKPNVAESYSSSSDTD
jgi:hypothetical protein